MENFLKTVLDLILLLGGCISAIITLALSLTIMTGAMNGAGIVLWTMALGIGSVALIVISIRSLRKNN